MILNLNVSTKVIERKFGCITPFGSKKKKICTNVTIGEKIAKLDDYSPVCKLSCDHLIDFDISEKHDSPGQMKFRFKEQIRRYESKYTYGLVDLFAALSGYLGSFLGVSLFHLRDGLAYAIRKLISQ